MDQKGYFGRVWAALTGRDQEEQAPKAPEGGPEARIASLEMDVRERDERIARMQTEYATLRADSAHATEGARMAEVEVLCKRLSSPLANMLALRALHEAGKSPQVDDLLALVDDLTTEVLKSGLEPIGDMGKSTEFDIALHQRMSGASVHAGAPVIVRLPGFRLGDRILLKAMVSTKGAGDGQGRD